MFVFDGVVCVDAMWDVFFFFLRDVWGLVVSKEIYCDKNCIYIVCILYMNIVVL